MAAALRKLGFQVLDGFDLDKTAFERKVRDFSVALREADVGLFFYAGPLVELGTTFIGKDLSRAARCVYRAQD